MGLCKCNGTHASQTEGMDHVSVHGAASCIITREREEGLHVKGKCKSCSAHVDICRDRTVPASSVFSLFLFSIYNLGKKKRPSTVKEREGLSSEGIFQQGGCFCVCQRAACDGLQARTGGVALKRLTALASDNIPALTTASWKVIFFMFCMRTDACRHTLKLTLPPSRHPAHWVGQTHTTPPPPCLQRG